MFMNIPAHLSLYVCALCTGVYVHVSVSIRRMYVCKCMYILVCVCINAYVFMSIRMYMVG